MSAFGSNKGTSGSSGDSGDSQGLTMEAILAEVNKSLDTKLAATLDNFKKTGLNSVLEAQLGPITQQFATINETLAKLATGTPQGGGQGEGDKGGQKGLTPELNAEMRQLKSIVDKQGSTIKDLQVAKEAAEKHAEKTDRHSAIRAASVSYTHLTLPTKRIV